jgi:hypothetical protein
MSKQIFKIFKSDSLYEQALIECHQMLDIDGIQSVLAHISYLI